MPNTERERSTRFSLTVRLLCWEGAFAMAYETWLGPTYLSGLAGELGIPVLVLSFVSAVPYIGSIGQLVGSHALAGVPSLKFYTVRIAAVARALWAVPMVAAAVLGYRSYRYGVAFPAVAWFLCVAVSASLTSILAVSSGAAWMAWMGRIIPARVRGRFFGVRQRYTVVAMVIANTAASLCLGWRPHGLRAGYALVGSLAILSAALSTIFLSRVPDAAENPLAQAPSTGLLVQIREILADEPFRRLVAFGALISGAVMLAGPYFPYYFTRELKIPMSAVASWVVLTNCASFLAAPLWGKQIDRAPDLRRTLLPSLFLMALSPLPYIFSAGFVRVVGPIEYFVNGFAWSGFQLSIMTLFYQRAPAARSAQYWSVYSAACGLSGALCTFIGGQLAVLLAGYGGFRALWLIAAAARISVLLAAGRLLWPQTAAKNCIPRSPLSTAP